MSGEPSQPDKADGEIPKENRFDRERLKQMFFRNHPNQSVLFAQAWLQEQSTKLNHGAYGGVSELLFDIHRFTKHENSENILPELLVLYQRYLGAFAEANDPALFQGIERRSVYPRCLHHPADNVLKRLLLASDGVTSLIPQGLYSMVAKNMNPKDIAQIIGHRRFPLPDGDKTGMYHFSVALRAFKQILTIDKAMATTSREEGVFAKGLLPSEAKLILLKVFVDYGIVPPTVLTASDEQEKMGNMTDITEKYLGILDKFMFL